MSILDVIGWIGSSLFSLCALPQTIKVWKDKHGNGLSWVFLLMWLLGEILCLIYTSFQQIVPLPLVVNYIVNLAMLVVIIYYKIHGHIAAKN